MKHAWNVLVAGALLIAVAGAGWAKEGETTAAQAAFSRIHPGIEVSAVRPSPLEGLFEVATAGGLYYFSPATGIVLDGTMYDRDMENLTARAQFLSLVAEKGHAIKVGNGPVEVIEVSNPDCSHCRVMHEYWKAHPEVTRYVFLVAAEETETAQKVRYIFASRDPEKALRQVYEGDLDDNAKVLAAVYDDRGALAETLRLTELAGVAATPAFLVSGHYVAGADQERITQLLAEAYPRTRL